MDVDVWPVQLPLMPRKYLPTTFHIQGVSEVRIRRSILRVESQEESGRTLETVVSSLESSIPSATDTFMITITIILNWFVASFKEVSFSSSSSEKEIALLHSENEISRLIRGRE